METEENPGGAPGLLRARLEQARSSGLTMTAVTVLDPKNDPYRCDTPAGHRLGEWLGAQLDHAIGPYRCIHLRGLHYVLIGVLKPNGELYTNTDAEWAWLVSGAAKAARFLGYVPFERLIDARNSAAVIHCRPPATAHAWVSVGGLGVTLPDAHHLHPYAGVSGFEGRQPYRLVIFGEKTSLANVVTPIAKKFDADVYLPAGELSDTQIYQMAKNGADDGRPMRVFTLADCDPAGHQMPVSIGRKLQAMRDLFFPDLDFEVRSLALTVAQVRELGLPSTPLKETERRADRWLAAHGIAQTEIDALATLQPHVLAKIITDGLAPFYDPSLRRRVSQAENEWRDAAQAVVDEKIDGEALDRLRADAEEKLAEMRAEIEAIEDRLRLETDHYFTLPAVRIPEPVVDVEAQGKPLISSSWSWEDQTRALKSRKAYASGDAA